MALNFPASPSTGDVHNASNGLQYHFDGVKWVSQGAYNTSTINTLNFTQQGTGAVSRSVQNKLEDTVSVKDFGAVGDGTTDDTAAINNAIASLTYLAGTQTANGSTGGEVYFPAGRYKITDTIILTGKNGLHLHGEGVEATEIFMSSSDSNGKPIFKNADTFASNLVDCHITHMTLYGDGNTKANAHGVEFLNTNGCYLQNLSIYACKYGLYLRESWQLTLETIDAHGGTDQRCDIGVHLGEKPTNEGDVNNAVTANGVTVKDCITAGFRIVQGQGSKFVNCESGNTPIGFHIGEASSSISGFNAEFKKCQWLTFVNCLADTNTSFGWKIAKGATLTELSEMHFANCWSGYAINDTCISVDGANDLIFSNWLVINCGHGIKVLDSNKLQFSNFRIDQYNRNNNSSQGIKLTDSQHIFFEGILSSDNYFTNGDFIEVNDDGNACNSNTFVTRSSNTGTLVGSASRNFRNEQIQGGTIGLLEIQATGNNQSTVKYNNNANNWDVGITNQTDNYFRWVYSGSQVLFLGSNGTLFPATDNAFDLGAGGNRWDDVFATNGTIQTSDENLKQDIQSLTTAEKAVATALKGLIKTFKYKSAVTAKGDDARIHCGVIAQQVKAAFEAQSLKAEDYALFCFDQWDEKKSSDGSIIRTAGSAYSIRYNELLAFVISAL